MGESSIMPTFDEVVEKLRARETLPPLYPMRPWDESLSHQIIETGNEALFGTLSSGAAATMMDACRAGLLLWNDDLDRSHDIAQGIANATGSFWHAIMHRREGDAANSHYWWRRTGSHPAFDDVYSEAMSVLENESSGEAQEFAATLKRAGTWVPMEFVGRCEMARRGHLPGDWLQHMQVAEMSALLEWCRSQLSRS